MGKVSFIELSASRIKNKIRVKKLRLERKLRGIGPDKGQGFFDAYPDFFETSTSGHRNRLNKRYKAIIEKNRDIIQGKSILDIASHDGRWALAANKAGARHVLGIEAREHLVKNAQANMKKFGVPENEVEFALGDVFDVIEGLEPGRFDTIFCLGFFYHTLYHMELLNQIARLNPEHLILDTCVDVDPDPIVVVQYEDVTDETAGAVPDAGSRNLLLVGHPTKKALEMMLSATGFRCRYVDWLSLGIRNWEFLREYNEGQRVTVVGTRMSKAMPKMAVIRAPGASPVQI